MYIKKSMHHFVKNHKRYKGLFLMFFTEAKRTKLKMGKQRTVPNQKFTATIQKINTSILINVPSSLSEPNI